MKLLALAAVVLIVYLNKINATPTQECKIDVVFCIDNSASIGNYRKTATNRNWESLKVFLQKLVPQLNVASDKTRVGAVDFGDDAEVLFNLNKYSTESEVVAAMAELKYKGQSTNTTGGLFFARRMLTDPQSGIRGPEVPKVIILITDGNPTRALDTLIPEVNTIREAKIKIVGVGITKEVSKEKMLEIVSSATYFVYTPRFEYLDSIKDLVINDDTCKPIVVPPPPVTTTPVPPKRVCKVDLVFCIDNSDSIHGGDNWRLILDFAQHLVAQISVGPDESHIALVDFGYEGKLRFDLNQFKSEAEIKQAIASLGYRGERTNTAGGLRIARQVLTDPQYGARDNVPKIIVLITDGNPTIGKDLLAGEVALVKSANIRTMTIAVTDEVNEDLMKSIATSLTDYVHVAAFSTLDIIKNNVLNAQTCSFI
jgi:Mg-chelatase subunit ChlD